MVIKNNQSSLFIYPIRAIVDNNVDSVSVLQEIRMRIGKPLLVIKNGIEYYSLPDGSLVNEKKDALTIDERMLSETLQVFTSYSLYAYEEELRQGFLTIQGGHRVGISGKVVVENGEIKTVKSISSINVRMAHEIKGCADMIMDYLTYNNQVLNTLIISPPGAGKTTLLRDIIRQLSDGTRVMKGVTIGLVDERSEIAACYRGSPQNDIGIRTDVLDCCPKQLGMSMLLRSMSPEVIAVDEIGSQKDYEGLKSCMYSGCKILATVHGNNYDDLLNKPVLSVLVGSGYFERYIILNKRKIEKVLDSKGRMLYGNNQDK